MSLPAGTRLGPYEILAPIGAGGMGDKARQTLSEMLELSKRRYVSPVDIAVVYAGMDDKERALDWLHGEPRFAELLRRIGLSS